MPENHGCSNLFLPDHWSRRVKSALPHVISLARLAGVYTWAWAAESLDTRIGQEVVADKTRGHPPLAPQNPDEACGTHGSPMDGCIKTTFIFNVTRDKMASPRGVEPLTIGSGGQRSIQLSYGDARKVPF